MSESVKKTLLERRSVRRYEEKDISEEDLKFIREAVRNTPTSYNGQQYSVIEIHSRDIKEKLFEIVGQKQLKTAAVDFIFLADFNKALLAAQAKGIAEPEFFNTADGLIVGTVDAALAMMSAITAAQSRGLGSCPIGYARTVNPKAISQLLALPQHVYAVCALAIGIPREEPDLKPKQPEQLLFFKDQYSCQNIQANLLRYDQEIIHYHQTRNNNNSDEDWIGQMMKYYEEGMGYDMLNCLRDRGFAMQK